MTELHFDFSGVSVSILGLAEALARRFRNTWSPFVAPEPRSPPFLRLEFAPSRVSPASGPFRPKAMTAEFDGSSVTYRMPEGEMSVQRGGDGVGCLGNVDEDRAYFTTVNFLRAALAYRLPERGGALVHAAGIVVRGRAFALVGGAGAGKTTWANLGAQGGSLVLTDDLLWVDRTAGEPSALSAPFRSTYRGPQAPPGRWPLAAWLFAVHGAPPFLRPVPALLRHARLVANLPFIAEAAELDPLIDSTASALADAVPSAELRFGLDEGFLELLRDWERQRTLLVS